VIFISKLLALQVVIIDVTVEVAAVIGNVYLYEILIIWNVFIYVINLFIWNVAAVLVLVVACTNCLLVNWSSALSIFWKLPLNTQISSWDKLFGQCECT